MEAICINGANEAIAIIIILEFWILGMLFGISIEFKQKFKEIRRLLKK